jgi:cystathionine beta-synthase
MFNDEWMREKGFIDKKGLTAKDLLSGVGVRSLFTLPSETTISEAIRMMGERDISQVPVTQDGRIVGALSESGLFRHLVGSPERRSEPIGHFMEPAFPFVDISTSLESLSTMITEANPAVLVRDFKTDQNFILTRHDILLALGV